MSREFYNCDDCMMIVDIFPEGMCPCNYCRRTQEKYVINNVTEVKIVDVGHGEETEGKGIFKSDCPIYETCVDRKGLCDKE